MPYRWGIRRHKELPPGPPPPIALGTGQDAAPKPWWKRTPYVVAMVVLGVVILAGALGEPEEEAVATRSGASEDYLPRVSTTRERTSTTRERPTTTSSTTTTAAPTTTTAATDPPQTPPPTQSFAAPPPSSDDCHDSYPDFCIPPPPPDLDCGSAEIRGRKNFTVHQPDPHGFDGNRDGVGCES